MTVPLLVNAIATDALENSYNKTHQIHHDNLCIWLSNAILILWLAKSCCMVIEYGGITYIYTAMHWCGRKKKSLRNVTLHWWFWCNNFTSCMNTFSQLHTVTSVFWCMESQDERRAWHRNSTHRNCRHNYDKFSVVVNLQVIK